MTAQELLAAPVAQRQPERTLHQLTLDDLWHRAAFAETPDSRALWESRLEAARAQGPQS